MRPLRSVLVPAVSAAVLAVGLVGLVPAGSASASALGESPSPATATTGASRAIASLALANVGDQACSTNSLGGTAYASSCTGNGGQPEYWCADFARWVWANAGVSDTGWLTAAAGSFYTYGLEYGTLTGTPAVGDAAVFNYYGGGSAEHVAIVTRVEANGDIETASGDWGGESGTEAQFASTSSVVLNAPAYPGVIGSYPDVMGMTLSGFVAPAGVAVDAISGRATMPSGSSLTGTATLSSPNGVYRLGLSSTGQLVETAGGRTVWTAGTAGSTGDKAIMQSDGNFVLYSAAGAPLWSSGTGGHASANYQLAIYDNGGLAILAGSSVLWSQLSTANELTAGTSLTSGQALVSANGLYALYMQSDGNMVEYTAGRSIWWSGTGNNPGARALMRKNGRLVILSTTGHVLWSSGVSGGGGTAMLSLEDSGVATVVAGSASLWSNGV